MAKKSEMEFDRAKQKMEDAHQKKMEAIDRVADRARTAETAMHEKQVRMLDKAAERMNTAAEKASDVTSSVSGKAEQVASNVTMKAIRCWRSGRCERRKAGRARGRDYRQGGTTAEEAALDRRCRGGGASSGIGHVGGQALL